jgi:hypothetical protein
MATFMIISYHILHLAIDEYVCHSGPSLHVNPSFFVILSVAKNLVPLRTGSAKNPSHSSGKCPEILRRPNEFGLLRMTLLSALF